MASSNNGAVPCGLPAVALAPAPNACNATATTTTTTDVIRVAIRTRPLNERERAAGQWEAWAVRRSNFSEQSSEGVDDDDDDAHAICMGENESAPSAAGSLLQVDVDGRPLSAMYGASSTSAFPFDQILDGRASTARVYHNVAREIVSSALDGVNGTVFAYGQTSSGKSFTMQGNPQEPGIIPLAVRHIFERIQQTPDREFLLRVSYLEIYNETLKDLLVAGNDHLKIHETTSREVFVGNLTEELVTCPEDIAHWLAKGEGNRHIGVTNMNERSSRSHTIFRMVIESRERQTSDGGGRSSYSGSVRVSCLNLVDLAGSERVGHTGAEGLRLKEGGHINKSLLALGTVIVKLSEGNNHIPYRDSKLTRILQNSLGGNARTAIICTITPASGYTDETLSTLKFASRAMTIRNRPEINEVVTDEVMLKKCRREINELKRQLETLQNDDVRDQLRAVVSEKMQAEAENEAVRKNLEEYQREKSMLEEKIGKMAGLILNTQTDPMAQVGVKRQRLMHRRQTWFPGTLGGTGVLLSEEEDEDEGAGTDSSANETRPARLDIESLKQFSESLPVLKSSAPVDPTLADQLAALQKELEDTRELLEESESQCASLAADNQRLMEGVNMLATTTESTMIPAAALPAELVPVSQRIIDAEQSLNTLKDNFRTNVVKYDGDVQFLKMESSVYQSSYEAMNTSHLEIQEILAAHTGAPVTTAEMVDAVRQLLFDAVTSAKLKKENSGLHDQLIDLGGRETELVQQHRNEQALLLDQITKLEAQCRAREVEAEELKKRVSDDALQSDANTSIEIQQLHAEISIVNEEKSVMAEQISELQGKIAQQLEHFQAQTDAATSESTAKLEALDGELCVLKQELASLKQANDVLSSERDQVVCNLETAHSDVKALSTERDGLLEKLANASATSEEMEKLKAVLIERDAELKQMSDQLESRATERDVLMQKLQSASLMNEETSQLASTLAEREIELMRATEQLKSLSAERDDIFEKLNNATNANMELTSLTTTLAERDTELAEATSRISLLIAQVDELREILVSSEAQSEDAIRLANDNAAALTSQLETVNEQLVSANTELKDSRQQVDATTAELEAGRGQIESLEEELRFTIQERNDYIEKMKNLEEQLSRQTDASADASQYEDKIHSLESERADIQNHLENAKMQIEALTAKLKRADEERDNIVSSAELLQKTAEEYQQKNDELMTEILALRQQNEYASQAMDEFSHAKEQLREYEDQYQGVSAALQDARREVEDREEVIANGHQLVATLRDQIACAQDSRRDLELRYQQSSDNEAKLVADLNAEIARNQELAAHVEELSSRQNETAVQEQVHAKRVQDLEDALIDYQRLEITHADMRKEREWLAAKLEESQHQASTFCKQVEELSASLEEANRQLQDVMQSHDALAHANEQMERQLEITQQELDGVKQEYEHAVSQQTEELNAIRSEANEQLADAQQQLNEAAAQFKTIRAELELRALEAEERQARYRQNLEESAEATLNETMSSDDLQRHVSTQQQLIAELRREVQLERDNVAAAIAQSQAGAETQRAKSDGELRQALGKVHDLEKRLAALVRELNAAQELIQRFQMDMARKDSDLEATNKKLLKLTERGSATQSPTDFGDGSSLRDELEKHQKQHAQASKELQNALLLKNEEVTRSRRLEAELQHERAEKERLQRELSQTKSNTAPPLPAVKATSASNPKIVHYERSSRSKENVDEGNQQTGTESATVAKKPAAGQRQRRNLGHAPDPDKVKEDCNQQ